MDLLTLAGLQRGPRHAQSGRRGRRRRRPTRARAARERRRRGEARPAIQVDRHGLPRSAATTTPLTDERPGRLRRLRGVARTRLPSCRDFIVGNEPNLNRFWLPQFSDDGTDAAAPAYLALLAHDLRRAEGRRPARRRHRRRPLAARRRQSDGAAPDALADALHPRPRRRLPGERPHDADHGRARVPPVRGQLERAAERGAPEHDDDRARRLRQARRAARHGVRRHGAAGLDAADRLRRVRRRVADPGGARRALHGHRAGDRPARRRGDAGAVLPRRRSQLAFCQPNVRGILLFHMRRRGRPDRWQSGVFYADGTPKASLAPSAAADADARRGVDRAVRGTAAAADDGCHLVARRPARAALTLTCDIDCTLDARARATAASRSCATPPRHTGRAAGTASHRRKRRAPAATASP